MRILGLDPGTVATGFGIVVFDNGRLALEGCGVWRPAARMTLPQKLDFLFSAGVEWTRRPDHVFFGIGPDSRDVDR